jgi:ATP-dependent helicase HrpA
MSNVPKRPASAQGSNTPAGKDAAHGGAQEKRASQKYGDGQNLASTDRLAALMKGGALGGARVQDKRAATPAQAAPVQAAPVRPQKPAQTPQSVAHAKQDEQAQAAAKPAPQAQGKTRDERRVSEVRAEANERANAPAAVAQTAAQTTTPGEAQQTRGQRQQPREAGAQSQPARNPQPRAQQPQRQPQQAQKQAQQPKPPRQNAPRPAKPQSDRPPRAEKAAAEANRESQPQQRAPRPEREPREPREARAPRAPRAPVTPNPIPPITFPEALPVSGRREEIARAIANNQVVIVSGETGSGKTTQLPKIALSLGRGLGAGGSGLIGHTQPRRIAASATGRRIAEELGTPFGEVVGYKVRFTDNLAAGASVKLMTVSCWPKRRPIRCSRPTTRSSSTRRTNAASTSTSCSAT